MKQFNDITIIGIDQGYGNMKTANTIFPTAITAYDTAPMFKGDVLEYGGRFYRVGEGHKGFVADKSEDGDFYLLTLAAIAKELEQYRLFTASLCLAVGLPLSWVGSQRESFRQYLIKADRCELNRQIRADNKLLRELKAQLAKLSKVVGNTVEHIAETLERLRSSLIMLQYRLLVNHKQADTWKRQVSYYRPILQDYHVVVQQLADKKSEQEQLQTNRNALSPLQITQRRQLAEQIAALTEEIEELRSRQAMILHNLDCKNNGEARRFGSYLDKLEEMQERMATQRENLAQQLSATTKQYLEIENKIQPEDADAVHRHRTAMRKASTAEIYRQIQTTATVDDILFSKAEQRAEQITADTRNDAVFTRKPTEPTRRITPSENTLLR